MCIQCSHSIAWLLYSAQKAWWYSTSKKVILDFSRQLVLSGYNSLGFTSRTIIPFKIGYHNRLVKCLSMNLLMLWTSLGGTVSAWWGRCNDRLFPLVSLLSAYARAHHRPPSWATKLRTENHKTWNYTNTHSEVRKCCQKEVQCKIQAKQVQTADKASLSSSTSVVALTLWFLNFN